MIKRIIILLLMVSVSCGYFEISNDVPGIYPSFGGTPWLLWAENEIPSTLPGEPFGVWFTSENSSIIIGDFTPRVSQVGNTTLGRLSGFKNTGSFVVSVGALTLQNNDGTSNTAIGVSAFNNFDLDAGSAVVVSSVDFANNQVTSVGHGFVAESFTNFKHTTTDTLPNGLLVNAIEVWEVISADILECVTQSFSDAGAGTLTLTPQTVYTNSTALGFDAEPDASNQVFLGDLNVTEVKTAGSLTAAGAVLGSLEVTGVATLNGLILDVQRVTFDISPYTVLATDNQLFVDTDDGAVTLNMPAGVIGTRYRILNTGSSDIDVTIIPDGTELINGVNANETVFDGEKMILVYGGVGQGWW